MVLNIFPRRKETPEEPSAQPQPTQPEPSSEALAQPPRRTIRRVPRAVTPEAETVVAEAPAETPTRAPRARRAPRPKAAPATELDDATAASPVVTDALAPTDGEAPSAPIDGTNGDRPAGRRRRRGRGGSGAGASVTESGESESPSLATSVGDGSNAGILKALDRQSRQIEQLIHLQQDIARRGGGGGAPAGAPPARVGVFVDVANVELASDRLRVRFDWKKILDILTKDRTLVRAIAYSPVHDDPGVSIETQRFVEPFLDRGYKIVTKPLKRFQDGSVKANVDIELALDVIEMLDRLDVVCLISGDGDFQRLVEVVQAKGVRVEVVAVGTSTAANLRHAADLYIDLQSRLHDVRLESSR